MKKISIVIIGVVVISSCRLPVTNGRNSESGDKIFKLRLNPEPGTSYNYVISNEFKTEFESNGKETELAKKYDVEINFDIGKDSTGNYLLKTIYHKIHIYSKTGATETNIDADNAETSYDPIEKMLGSLKTATITATVSPAGDVISTTGYQSIANDILSRINTADLSQKSKAQQQWKQMVEQNLVKKNMEQLFKIFPDSAVHVGDRWKLFSSERNDVNFAVKNFYTLTAIRDGNAEISSEGEIYADSTVANPAGQAVDTDLKGKQEGTYSINVLTGMLTSCRVSSKITGTIKMLGQEVPVTIETSLQVEGKQVKK